MRKLLSRSILVLSLTLNANARSLITAEQGEVHSLVSLLNLYTKSHDGEAPTNWLEFSEFADLSKISVDPSQPVEQTYLFMTSNVPMFEKDLGNVFLIRATPVEQLDRGKGRYIISHTENSFVYNWLLEEKVQQMLAKAGVKELPKPEPLVPHTNTVQLPEFQTSNHSEAVKPLPKIQPNTNSERTETNLQAKSESVQNVQTTSSKWWKVTVVAMLIFLLFGWLAFRRKQKR